MSRFAAPISEQIWDMKYRLKDADGTPVDASVEDSWRRIARALASVETDPAQWEPRFYEALEDFRFLPAGRILAGAGTERTVTLFNCFVMGTIPDSLDGIFGALREAALTMQQGGGIGYDFSTIRPKGADVKGVAADASGPLSFMDVWDAMCRTIMSAGSRRGAMMACMRCDHPDIEAFIEAKSDPARLRNFNVSVLVTDAFMAAVKADGPWELIFDGKVYHTVEARDLWNRIMRATYDYAEPGVIFIDRINAANNLNYVEKIAATNPCGEQPLPPYGACLLGSVNLARLVTEPFEADAGDRRRRPRQADPHRGADDGQCRRRLALPAAEQADEAKAKRRIGLGVTGLADALMMLGLRYGSDEAVAQTEAWMHAIARAAYLASVDLAQEKGAFPLFEAQGYLASGNMPAMDADVRDAVAEHGIRNALVTSIAPTGTISLYAGNVSSGIEPVFAYAYSRKVLQRDGSRSEEEVVDYAVQLWRDRNGEAPLPDYFADAQSLAPADHVRMQAAAQKWVDSSISKTINVPEDISFDAFKDVYMLAWDLGLQGLHHLPAERGHRLGADGQRDAEAARRGREAGAGDRWRGGLYLRAARPAGRAGGRDLQAEMARQRARDLHHRQRHRHGRAAAAVRGVHQLEEHGAFRLDRGADADDLGGVPARRRCELRGRGAEGGVRSARRRLDAGQIHPLDPRRHRRGDRAAPGLDRLHRRRGAGVEGRPEIRGSLRSARRAASPARPAAASICG